MAQPTPNEGNRQMGAVQVESAIQLLDRALGEFAPSSPEHAAVVRAIGSLSKHFNRQKSKELIPAQLMELVQANKASPMEGVMSSPQTPPAPAGGPPGMGIA